MKAQGKRFLTGRGDEGGSVRWYASTNNTSPLSYYLLEAELYLTDCSKSITLEFSCDKHKHLAKRIAKLDVLLAELGAFKAVLIQAQDATKPKSLCY